MGNIDDSFAIAMLSYRETTQAVAGVVKVSAPGERRKVWRRQGLQYVVVYP